MTAKAAKASKSAKRQPPPRRIPPESVERLPFATHGAPVLPFVDVASYNLELKNNRGAFVGDQASKAAFFDYVDAWRKVHRQHGEDPLGDRATADLGKKAIERMLERGDAVAQGVVMSAIEDFAKALVRVIDAFREHEWPDVERIAIGGGFRRGRLGELVIARAGSMLAERGPAPLLQGIHYHPDEAGLVGAAHLLPGWMMAGGDALLAVDIGGGSIRCGCVHYRLGAHGRIRKAVVDDLLLWEHREDEASRTALLDELGAMLARLVARARKQGRALVPFVGIGCPGRIEADGRIDRGTQNLPGDWTAPRFHLPGEIRKRLPVIAGAQTVVLLHNDAVLQGLSELPRMRDVARWSVLTIGTGLGNAAFVARPGEAAR